MPKGHEKRSVHWAIKAFVLFHLFAITVWTVPRAPNVFWEKEVPLTVQSAPNHLLFANQRFREEGPIKFYLMPTGLWQGWDMFAPNPSNTDIWMDAIVTFQGGKEMVYKYPRIKDLPINEKYVKERYRKFFENANPDHSSFKWPAVAQRVAFLSYSDPGDPPVMVVLRKHTKVVEPPDRKRNTEYVTVDFFTYIVDQAKLREQSQK